MKTLLMIICLVALLQPLHAQNPKPETKIGYWIVVTDGKKNTVIKTESIVEVYAISGVVFPWNCVNFEKELSKSPYFQMYNYDKGFYVEKKIINKNGKYRRTKK